MDCMTVGWRTEDLEDMQSFQLRLRTAWTGSFVLEEV